MYILSAIAEHASCVGYICPLTLQLPSLTVSAGILIKPSLLDICFTMVTSGVAAQHVQPCPRNPFFTLNEVLREPPGPGL
jgi:hypothetical protein